MPYHLNFSANDRAAILCALPLVPHASTGDVAKDRAIALTCIRIREKLEQSSNSFTNEEIAVIGFAVSLALDTLENQACGRPLPVAADRIQLSDLRLYFFVYNHLLPRLDSL